MPQAVIEEVMASPCGLISIQVPAMKYSERIRCIAQEVLMFHFAKSFFHVLVTAALFFGATSLCAVTVATITSGPFPVGSTNFEVSSLSTSDMEHHLIGSYTSSADIYVSDLLLHAADCPSIDIAMPNDSSLFGRHANKRIHFVAYVLYPTTDDNLRPDYVFPYTNTDDHTFPHMQRTGEAPILRDPRVRYPLIINSHGYDAHGLWDLSHMKLLASLGYIVISVQHGDGRNTFQGCFGERPLVISRFLDYLLEHPVFGPAIDRERIGITGASLGGCTTLAIVGGGYNGSSLVPTDKRFHAAFSLVPLVSASYGIYPFGRDYGALAGIKCPFFAIYAQNDTNVPKATVEAALPKLQGTCAGVILAGQKHVFSSAGYQEAFTYEILFFNAWLRDNKVDADTLYGDMSVDGGVDDQRTYQHVVPVTPVDEAAAFGNCPASCRIGVSITGSNIRVHFPASTSGVIRYDLMGSTDLKTWQCLRTSEVVPAPGEIPDQALPAGFKWRFVEVQGNVSNITQPLFMSVRVSQ